MDKNQRVLDLIEDLNDFRQSLKDAEMDLEKSHAWIEKIKGWIFKTEDEISQLKGRKLEVKSYNNDMDSESFSDMSGAGDSPIHANSR